MRRAGTVIFTIIFCLSICIMPQGVLAGSESLDNFVVIREYSEQFTDVAADSWYHENVALLYELGLTNGSGAGKYSPDSDVTLAEVAMFTARIHSIYYTGSADAFVSDTSNWYDGAVEYLKNCGIIDNTFDGDFDRAATRAESAGILAHAIPEYAVGAINSNTVDICYYAGTYIRDVTSATAYKDEILTLYSWGVLNGSGHYADFLPDASISRAEFAAMLTRLVEPSLRISLNWDTTRENSAVGTTLSDLIDEEAAFIPWHDADDFDAIRSNVAYMLKRNELSLTLRKEVSSVPDNAELSNLMRTMLTNYQSCIREFFFEQSCGGVQIEGSVEGNVIVLNLQFGYYTGSTYGNPVEKNIQEREKSMSCAVSLHDYLWSSGMLNGDMSQTEIARVYYTWIIDNCRYDNVDLDKSHSALGVFEDGLAVCDGYTRAYNLLLELEGIDCNTACTDTHIWTVATLDGTTYHIDTTWGDCGDLGADYTYFCMTSEYARSRPGL